MTTPGGVPNLPMGALTLDTLATKLQDMSGTAMKSRAVERFPSIFDSSTGLSPASDITPFGILTRIWAEVNSLIATADPNDIQGPEDLPPLVLEFIEGLPVVGQFVELLEAILGTYDGDDTTLLAIQTIFAPIRKLMQVIGGSGGVPIGAISHEQPNLAIAPTFAAGSIEDNPYWTVDLTSSRTADGTGSAKVTADGTTKALRSGRTHSDTYAVSAGQTFSDSIFVSHEGYSGSGPAVLLQVVPFIGNTPGAPVALMTTSPGTGGDPDVLVPATYTPAGADLAWPGYELAGNYVVPEGVTGVQTRIELTENALTGTFNFDDAYPRQSGLLSPELVDGLPGQLQEIFSRWQLLARTISNALTGSETIPDTIEGLLENLTEAFQNINPASVGGVNGPANMRESVLGMLDALVGGAVGQQGTGASNADAFNIFKLLSSRASQGSNAWEVQGERNNSPVDNGLLPSSEANFNLSVVNTTLTVTPTASLIMTMRVQRSAPLGVVSWLGCGTAGVTAFYLNIRKIDSVTGARDLVYHSPNIVGDLVSGSTPGWEFCTIADPLARVATEDYEYEWVTVGANHSIRGISFSDAIPDHPYAHVVALGATRDSSATPDSPPSTIAKAAVVSSQNVPWAEAAIDTGNSSTQHDAETTYLTLATTFPIPNWAKYVDRVVLGKGGNASAGFGGYGKPGTPGRFNADTLERDVDFSGTGTIITYSPADDDTANTTMSIPGNTITAENGENGAGTGDLSTKPIGKGPGTLEYGDELYPGGLDQTALGGAGTGPGGAGNGGHWLTGFLTGGGKGANGGGWVRFRPGPIEGGGTPIDTTPPTAPTLITLVDSTPSTLTITISGGTD